jgi:hypothetical protein
MRLPFLALAAAALLTASAHAQQVASTTPTTPPPPIARTAPALLTRADTLQALKEMASSLMNLTIAQEGYWAKHGTYTTDASALGTHGKQERAHAQVIFAGGRGWTGMATFRGLKGKSCVSFVGDVEATVKLPVTQADRRTPKSTQEGQPVCDTP